MGFASTPAALLREGFKRRALAAAAALFASAAAQAITFVDALDAARQNDPTYRAAGHEFEVARLSVPIARAALLPVVTLSAGESKVLGSRRFANGQNQEVQVPLDYTAPQASLQMRVPLLNYEAYATYRQAQAQGEVADAVYRSQGLDLMERLTTGYLQTLLSQEGLRLAQAQAASYEVLLGQAEQRLQRGEGTRVQVAQYKANVDVSRTRVLEAADQVDLARIRLERLTGIAGALANPLKPTTEFDPLIPSRLGEWFELALRQSPTLQSRDLARTVAREGVRRQQAGHLPRVDLVASLARSENDTSSNVGQSARYRSVGVQLNVPLYNGGGVDASVRQANARVSQAEEELRTERDNVEVEVQRNYQAVVSGEKKVGAYVQACQSSALAALGARRSMETGLGTAGDVADTQAALFNAARDLVQARVEVVQARVRLMLRAGIALPDIAADVDRALVASPGPGSTLAPAAPPPVGALPGAPCV